MLGIVPQSLGSPAAPPAAGGVLEGGAAGVDAGGAAPGGLSVSEFAEALASACKAARNDDDGNLAAAPPETPDRSLGVPGVWLDLSGRGEPGSAAPPPSADGAQSVETENTADSAAAVDASAIAAAASPCAAFPVDQLAAEGAERASHSVAEVADGRGIASGRPESGDAAEQVDGRRTTISTVGAATAGAAVTASATSTAASEAAEAGEGGGTAHSDAPIMTAAAQQRTAVGTASGGERPEPPGGSGLPAFRRHSDAMDAQGAREVPAGSAKAGPPADAPRSAAADRMVSSPVPSGSGSDTASPSARLDSRFPPPGAAGGRTVPVAVHETVQATTAPTSEAVDAPDLSAAGDAAAPGPSGGEGGSERGHSSPGDTHARATGGDVPVHRPGPASPALFSALITAADGTLRLGAPLAMAGAATLAADEHIANIQRMVQTMRVMVRDTVSEATIRLRPEHLGEVTIDVKVDGKSVSAVIHSESATVREWMQGQESTLRNGLSEHGLNLDKLHVQRDGRQDARDGQQQPERRRGRARQTGDAQGTFEITV